VWNLNGGSPGVTTSEAANARLFFSPHGDLFASRDDEGFRWRVIQPSDPALAPHLEPVMLPQPPGFTSLCLAANRLVVTGQPGTCSLDVEEAKQAKGAWLPTTEGISGASPDGHWLAIFRPYTRRLHIYRLPDFESIATLTNHTSIAGFEFSPRGDELAVATPKAVEIWDTSNWQRTRELTNFVGLLYSPDNSTFWLTKDYRIAGLYHARTLQLLLPLPVGTLPLAVSHEGRHLAVSVDSRRLQVWDLVEVKTFLGGLGLDW
jgi:hypothetical protein